MNIDWNQTMQGYSDELDKTANVVGDAFNKAKDKVKGVANSAYEGAKNLVQKPINAVQDKMTDIYNNSAIGQAESGLNNLGNIASTVAPLGLAAMMSGGFGGGNKGAGGNTYNYNYGAQDRKNPLLSQPKSSVGSLASTNTFDNAAGPMVAQASYADKIAGLVDTVAGVVRNRAINDIIDKSVGAEEPSTAAPEATEKEVEITSKYPEMTKLLEDEQNKAYLQKLLKN